MINEDHPNTRPGDHNPLLSVKDLIVRFGEGDNQVEAVSGISFDVPYGSVVGVVGESGSGKSVTSLALTRLFPKSSRPQVQGSVQFKGQNLLTASGAELRAVRGGGISYVFQDPLSSLDPMKRCGDQVLEAIHIHEPQATHEKARDRVITLFERLGLPRAREVMRKYPHELSGGMRQRVMMAIALACRPALLIADEPTTALDVVVQKQIVDLLREIVEEFDTSVLFISHDLALVSSIAQTVVVMRDGKVVEAGDTAEVSQRPQEAYTRQLWNATPTLQGAVRSPLVSRRNRPASNILEVKSLNHTFGKPRRGQPTHLALDDVSLTVQQGETVCVVGESGSGKTTLGRSVVGLITPNSGQILFNGKDLAGARRKGWRSVRRDIQMVFQDPYASLNPRMRVGELISEGLIINRLVASRKEARNRAIELLETVGLPERFAERFPHQFSGGQRQRIAIARALAVRPRLLVCDEPVTSLDVSVRAQIVKLLIDIQDREGVSYLFITHDLALARQIGDRAVVMNQGKVVEAGTAVDIIDRPTHPYTRALRAAVPEAPAAGSVEYVALPAPSAGDPRPTTA